MQRLVSHRKVFPGKGQFSQSNRGIAATIQIMAVTATLFTALSATTRCIAAEPSDTGTPELLWPNGAPDAVGTQPEDQPTLFVHLPKKVKANGTAVVILPGGGYGALAIGYEGHDVGEWLNEHGVTTFVLRYRLAPRYRHPAPLQDAQRSLRMVRSRCKEWGVDPQKIGILGFSAGGHLASTAATHFDAGSATAADPIDRVSCRPDFAVLCYPVISLKENFTHAGSRANLLGNSPDPKLVESLSNETQVTAETPPTFLFHTAEDTAVPPENSIAFYTALRAHKIPCELHIYEKGVHGVGMAQKIPVLNSWPDRLVGWMQNHDLIPSVAAADANAASGK